MQDYLKVKEESACDKESSFTFVNKFPPKRNFSFKESEEMSFNAKERTEGGSPPRNFSDYGDSQ